MFENLTLSFSGIWNSFVSYMTELVQNPFKLLTLVLDLAIVTYILYKFIVYAKKSRMWQLLKGILFILIITAISEALQLKILNFILTAFMPYGVIALIVIFAPELRRMLEQLGTNKLTRYFGIDKDLETKTKEDVYKVVIATTELAKTKTGGLIVIERDIKLNDIIDKVKSYQNILIDNCEEIYDELRNINITDRKQRNQHNREVKSTKRK